MSASRLAWLVSPVLFVAAFAAATPAAAETLGTPTPAQRALAIRRDGVAERAQLNERWARGAQKSGSHDTAAKCSFTAGRSYRTLARSYEVKRETKRQASALAWAAADYTKGAESLELSAMAWKGAPKGLRHVAREKIKTAANARRVAARLMEESERLNAKAAAKP